MDLNTWILTLITFIPLLGAIVILFLPKDKPVYIKWTALIFSIPSLVLSIYVWLGLNSASGQMQFVMKKLWIPSLNVHYYMGVDGISTPLVFLSALLTTLCLIYSWFYQ